MVIGPAGAGKSTLIKALRANDRLTETVQQSLTVKTQTVLYEESMIDTPGEYVQIPRFYSALLVTSLEAAVVLLVLSAIKPGLSFPPAFAGMFSRPVAGVVTKIDLPGADPKAAESVLKQAGVANPAFLISAVTGAGLDALRAYLAGLPER